MSIDKSMNDFLTKMAAILIGYSVGLSGPTYAYFADGIRTTTFNLKVTLTDEKSSEEFAVNMFLQTYVATFGGCVIMILEIMMDLFRNVVEISPLLIEHRLRNVISAYSEQRISENELRSTIRDIEMQVIDYDWYEFV